jgi:hypothetical protein
MLGEMVLKYNIQLNNEAKSVLVDMFSEQESFSRVRNIDKASVKLHFRIMTEVKAEGNILNKHKYPEIKDNTVYNRSSYMLHHKISQVWLLLLPMARHPHGLIVPHLSMM